jgi:putative nucleotidyltransferase with HDIG domain
MGKEFKMRKEEMNREEMYKLLPELELVQSVKLREICADIWIHALEAGGWFEKDGWGEFPFSVIMKLDCPENLLTHTGQVTRTCAAVYDSMVPLFGRVGECNKEELIVGALLHDVGKLIEYDLKDGKPCYSKTARKFRHPFWSAYFAKEHGLNENIIHMVLTHSMIVSPEGPRAFLTPESWILKVIDDMCFKYVEMHCAEQGGAHNGTDHY